MSMEKHWRQFQGVKTTPADSTSTASYYYFDPNYPYEYWPHYWYEYWPRVDSVPTYTPTPRNNTEEAYKILKALVEKKVIKEPTSFKKFCELVETIAEVIKL